MRRFQTSAALPVGLGAFLALACLVGATEPKPVAVDPPGRGITLVVTGAVMGELEPCGCIWSARGGLAREATVVHELVRAGAGGGDDVVHLDLGNVRAADPSTAELRNGIRFDEMRRRGVSLIAVGADDAWQGYSGLEAMAQSTGARLLSANFVYHDSGEPAYGAYAVVGGRGAPRVAVVGLTREDRRLILGGRRNRTLLIEPPQDALARWIPRAAAESDHVIVIGDLRRHEANAVLREHPEVLAVLIPNANDMPEGPLAGATGVLTFGNEGRQVLSYRIGPDGRTRAHRVTLQEEVPADPEVLARLDPVLDEMNARQRRAHRDALPLALDGAYVGGDRCAECHEPVHRAWAEGPHARAFDTLVAANREWSPTCAVCHATGTGAEDAWIDPALTPGLASVQCEACHGPGREHADGPRPGYGAVEQRSCDVCHRTPFSTPIVLEQAWPRLPHAGRSGDRSP